MLCMRYRPASSKVFLFVPEVVVFLANFGPDFAVAVAVDSSGKESLSIQKMLNYEVMSMFVCLVE